MKPKNIIAKDLHSQKYRIRVISNKKKYKRKSKKNQIEEKELLKSHKHSLIIPFPVSEKLYDHRAI